jgi:hypothetical protein
MVWGVGWWNVVCIGNLMDNGVVVVCERTNWRCELQGSMRHDKLKDTGCFVSIRKEVCYEHNYK